jgi:exodeoxyribonuclease V gamma subunit
MLRRRVQIRVPPLQESALPPNSLPPGLMLVHGNHPEALRDLLVTWMRRYPLAPLETETLLVHSNGIAQWLRLALAEDADEAQGGGCGIAAGLDMSLPSRFLWQVYRAVLGREGVPEQSPFDKSLLTWRLMRLLPELLEQATYAPLQRFLSADADLRKRFQLAERLADLFDQYQVYRADWLAAWAAGEDVLIRAAGDRLPLPDEQRWQANLWRALLADVAAAEGGDTLAGQGRAAVHEAFLRRIDAWPDEQRPIGLPRRVMVFGISAMPRQSLEVLAALARWTQVLMCVHNPCEHFWADIVADKDLLRATRNRQQRRIGMPAEIAEENLHLHAHPLLAAWGKQGRDFIGLLDEHDSDAARAGYLQHFVDIRQRIDLFSSHGQARLLNQLQDDIRDLRPLGETRARWPAVADDDDSIRFHIAHSAQREVEVLHDQLLAAFNADPSLRPRDVIVMVPDIDAYAPHIQAVFGLTESFDPRFIPFSIADQGRRHHDPLVNALGKLLDLPNSRVAVSDVLDLLEVPALRSRFGIADDDLPLLHRWIHGAQVRWGLHAEHRESLGLPDAPDGNTWLFGLRRMLLGYAVGATGGAWHDIEPFDEIGGLDAALLGPLAQLLERIEITWRAFATEASPADWCLRLRALMADFFDPDESSDAYTLQQLELALERLQAACAQAGLDSPLPLAVVGEHWLAQLDDAGLSQRFFAGAVTFATLMPMRAIPFRQVCLLGLNDGDYPRTRVPMDFDLMGGDYRPGDRSRREDDRYLFLEALLSARERLLISWVGHSINDNSVRPPSVLVGQLRDHLVAGWRLAGHEQEEGALLGALTVVHRLQPFNPDYFPSNPTDTRLFTYAHEWRMADDRTGVSGTALAPAAREEPLRIAELAAFLRDPVKSFFNKRLHVDFELDDPVSEDQEPFDLDGLQKWSLWNELIAAQAEALDTGAPREAALDAGLERIRRRGDLAAGAFADVMADALAGPMEDLFERYQKALAAWPDKAPHDEELRYRSDATGLDLEDWLRDLRLNADGQRGRVVLETSDAVKKGKYQRHNLIKHWLVHLAGHLTGEPVTTLIVSKAGDVRFEPLDTDDAKSQIEDLLAAWQEGMARPLPLAAKTAFARLDDLSGGRNNAPGIYEGAYMLTGEVESSPYLQRTWPDFEALSGTGEFDLLANRLLRPLYDATFASKTPSKPSARNAGEQA